jgi:hypothetical protein
MVNYSERVFFRRQIFFSVAHVIIGVIIFKNVHLIIFFHK